MSDRSVVVDPQGTGFFWGHPAYGFVALILVGCFLAASIVVGMHGYGDNLDNYGMLHAWQGMLLHGDYEPSRFQGNIVSEFVLGFLASQGGPYAANAFSFAASIASLVLLWKIFVAIVPDKFRIALVLLTVALNPYWVLAGSTSMDYLHPLPFCLLGILLLMRKRPSLAALCFAVAAATRLTYVLVGPFAMLMAWRFETNRASRVAICDAVPVFLAVGGLFFLPVFIRSHLTFSFLTAGPPVWLGWLGHIARFVYKSVSLYGVIGTGLALIALCLAYGGYRRRGDRLSPHQRRLLALAAVAILYHLLVLWMLPARILYLLPVLPAVGAALLIWRADHRWVLGLALSQLLFWFVAFDPIEVQHVSEDPCAAVIATGASLRPHLAPGIVREEFSSFSVARSACDAATTLILQPRDMLAPLPPPLFHRDPVQR